MARRFSFAALVSVLVFGLCVGPSYGQVGSDAAQLNGTVRDVSGGTIAKASVPLRDTDTNRSYSTVSNGDGLYVFATVPPGHYELRMEASGFAKSTQTGIVLTVG